MGFLPSVFLELDQSPDQNLFCVYSAFNLRCAPKLDGCFRMNNRAFIRGQVGVHCGYFRKDGGVFHG